MRHQNTVRVRRTSGQATHSTARKATILAGIDESVQRLSARDAEFFAKSLPKSEHWRAYNNFKDGIAFVDIETTGLSPHYAHITVVGIYDGKKVNAFVRGIDLDGIVDEFTKYDFLITYNDARFDMPFIKHEYHGSNSTSCTRI